MLFDFYTIHYNLGLIVFLLVILGAFFAIKKNFKGMLVMLALLIVFNVFNYNKTKDKTWTRVFYSTDEIVKYPLWDKLDKEKIKFHQLDTMELSFAAKSKDNPWVVYSETGDTLRHWCWVDEWWEKFSQTDVVAWIWGENAGKKVRGSSESRLNGNIGE